MRHNNRASRIPSTRREFLKTGTGVAGTIALATILPKPSQAMAFAQTVYAQFGSSLELIPPVEDPRIKALMLRALDAAKSAGADYADARMTHTFYRSVHPDHLMDGEEVHMSIRALVRGYWGFSASPVLGDDECVRLARAATFQAQTNALGKVRPIDMAPAPVVADGHWTMPVKIDPFREHPLALQDYLGGLITQIRHEAELGREEFVNVITEVNFAMQDRALATTDGTYVTQRVYRTEGALDVAVSRLRPGDMQNVDFSVDLLSPAAVGWELFHDQPIREAAHQLIREARAEMDLPQKRFEVGRFNAVLDAKCVASLVSRTIGAASELDRALGYEANATGTSYLNDPLAMLGTFVVGSPLLTVTANRSEPGALATVQWDDEGVIPTPFTVVEHGVLRNYHCTREGAGWLRASGVKRPFQSFGVAGAVTAVDAPLPQTANLVLEPGKANADYHALIADMGTGVAASGAGIWMDFQLRSGMLFFSQMYDVKRGKRVARIVGGGIPFNTTQLWKTLIALGGADSAQRFGLFVNKGEPPQQVYHSVTAVPATFKELTVVDIQKR